jgi:antirestriction protein ArdC
VAVFNVAQCDNLPDHCIASAPALPEREMVPQAEALATATLADIRTGGAHAFYRPSEDVVQIPPRPAFFDQINYYRTLFHELGHYAESRVVPSARRECWGPSRNSGGSFGIIRDR